jgi:hypothetical protein
MLRYYRRGTRTRTAETRRYAQRLTRHGWRRCTPGAHREAWRARDGAGYARAVGDAAATIQRMTYAERVKLGI